jgi:hypothetical protein
MIIATRASAKSTPPPLPADSSVVFCSLCGAEKGCFLSPPPPYRWPSLMKHYSPTDYVNWLEEYKVRQKAGLEARKIVASFSKRFFSEHVSIRLGHALCVCVCVCVCVCMCVRARTRSFVCACHSFSALVPISLFTAHTALCLHAYKSHCVPSPPVQQHGAICPC